MLPCQLFHWPVTVSLCASLNMDLVRSIAAVIATIYTRAIQATMASFITLRIGITRWKPAARSSST